MCEAVLWCLVIPRFSDSEAGMLHTITGCNGLMANGD